MSKENPEIQKTESEIWDAEVEFGRSLEFMWEDGKDYIVGDVRRPQTPNGFEFRCTSAGMSGFREPTWKKEVNAVTKDGSVEWTAQKPTSSGRDSIQSRSVTSPSGITVSNDSISGTLVLFRVEGGTYDVTADPYEISVEVLTVAGERIEKKVFVEITGE
ncbi:MAG: hypothetical protein QNJ14_19535 [Woeseiaceae bacterium]|nr:hypothetical protein [Woeseiaceae bacterium]